MIFARRVFLGAGAYGLLTLTPMYFLEAGVGPDLAPPLTHPEHFYGFVGVALAWQLVFLVIGRDPVRYRIIMLPAILEKLSFSVAVYLLYSRGRVGALLLGPGGVDFMLAVLFAVAFWKTRSGGNLEPVARE